MAQPIPVPPRAPIVSATQAAPDPEHGTDESIARFLPSWLTSLVVHLSLVLGMALLVVNNGSWNGDGLAINLQSGADGQGDGRSELDDSIAVGSQLSDTDADTLAVPQVEALEQHALEPPQIKLAGLDGSGAGPDGNGAGLGGPAGDDEGGEGAAGSGAIGMGPVRTEVFGVSAEGATFVYVFDRSESMNSVLSYSSEGTTVFSITPLDAAKAELLSSLEDLDRGHRFGIVFYNHESWLFSLGQKKSKVLVAATKDNKRRAAAFVGSMYGQGQTYHVKPLEIALKMRPDAIFLLTDGEPKDDPTAEQLEQLRKLNNGRTKINVIQFCYKAPAGGALVQLAEENGGQHIFFNIARLGPGLPGAGPRRTR